MRKTQLTLIILLFSVISVFAQIPTGLNFQGIARDADGTAIVSEPILVQISIQDNMGLTDYSESHNLNTDAAGLFSLVIGNGDVISGDYQLLNWAIQRDVAVGIDIGSDGNFDIEFITPFQSVPYANYSKYTENVNDADADPANELQFLSIDGNQLTLSDGGTVMIPSTNGGQVDDDADPSNELQTISIDGNEITLSDGGTITLPGIDINDADSDPTNEIQSLSIDGNQLTLSDGGTVVIPTSDGGEVDADADPSNELQTISIDGNEITLSDGGNIVLPTDQVNDADADPANELQSLSIDGNEIFLSNGGNIVLPADQVNDADADPANELQTISIDGNEVFLSDGGNIVLPADQVNDADADPANELQSLTISGNQLTLSDGGTVVLPTTDGGEVDADADPTNELQSLSIDGNVIFLSDGGNVSLPTDQTEDADADPANELQTISIDGAQITLSDGGSIELPPIDIDINDEDADPTNELQELTLEGNVLSISDGNSVELLDSSSSVIVGIESADVPENPTPGQLYFDESENNFYIYHEEGWTEILLGETVSEIYVVEVEPLDTDMDGIIDTEDNCPDTANPDQSNIDGDNLGDICDWDIDGDGIANGSDSCPEDYNPTQEDLDNDGCEDDVVDGLHPAFAEFDTDSYTIYLDGDNVVIETDGLPNHGSPYWSTGHPLDIDPVCTTANQMAPGDIDDFNGVFTLNVPANPVLAATSSATGLGAIGLAISGSVIYNDEEGPNVPLDNAVGSLDCDGAHTGPQSYHYHLEPVSWSDDDENLIGIMSDGFFIYGRRDYDGTYPSDLDVSGGHFGPTPHNPSGEYHYHIQNNLYLNAYYILFPGDYQGTPNAIGM